MSWIQKFKQNRKQKERMAVKRLNVLKFYDMRYVQPYEKWHNDDKIIIYPRTINSKHCVKCI